MRSYFFPKRRNIFGVGRKIVQSMQEILNVSNCYGKKYECGAAHGSKVKHQDPRCNVIRPGLTSGR